ncbi:MAG: DNA polymerase III subunit delta [Lachnospiraceae bacterium]|nr:DNA polymerase III subunit delta [Lachnospiraceae bacterium]
MKNKFEKNINEEQIKLKEHIEKGELKNVYLLYGPEQQVVKMFRNRLLKALMGTASLDELKQDMNFSLFRGNPIDMDALVSIASSYPFMAEKRVILVEHTKAFSKENEDLILCINNLPETTYIIFVEEDIKDKKGPFNAVKEKGITCFITTQTKDVVESWIINTIKANGKRISRAALDTLIMRAGLDMLRITNELDKIIAYKGDDQDIKTEDIVALVSVEPEEEVFKMIDAMSDGDTKLAMRLYLDLLELKVNAVGIIVLIERQMKILFQVKDMRDRGFDEDTIADTVKDIRSYYVKKYIRQAQKFSMREIMECLDDCAEFTLQLRTGAITGNMAAEYIIVKYSRHADRR